MDRALTNCVFLFHPKRDFVTYNNRRSLVILDWQHHYKDIQGGRRL